MRLEDEIKSKFRNEYQRTYINILYTAKQLSRSFSITLKQHGISEPQYNLLRILRGAQKPVSLQYIRERMLDKSSDVSRVVDKLVRSGYVERKIATQDRRQKAISLSEKGHKLLTTLEPYTLELEKNLQILSSEELNELNRLLDKLRAQFLK